MTFNDRFEIVGELYYADTGHLRPGKDSRLSDSCSPENNERFEQWLAMQAFTSAIKRIHALQP